MEVVTAVFPVLVVAQTWHNNALPATVAVGICFHLFVARPGVEFEQSMRQFLCVAVLFSGVHLSVLSFLANQTVTTVMVRLVSSWTGFSSGLFLSLTIYRLCFHRCRFFPGPVAARFTRFYVAYLNGQKAQFYERLRHMHDRYGDVLRLGTFV